MGRLRNIFTTLFRKLERKGLGISDLGSIRRSELEIIYSLMMAGYAPSCLLITPQEILILGLPRVPSLSSTPTYPLMQRRGKIDFLFLGSDTVKGGSFHVIRGDSYGNFANVGTNMRLSSGLMGKKGPPPKSQH